MHAFVDESIRRDYLLAVVLCAPGDLGQVRRALRALLLPGQSSVHFRKEDDRRRRQVLTALAAQPLRAQVFVATSGTPSVARQACLGRAATDLLRAGVSRLVIEQSDGDLDRDRRTLYVAARSHGDTAAFAYVHQRRQAEPLLWAADAVAWAWARGGTWRARLTPLSPGMTVVDR